MNVRTMSAGVAGIASAIALLSCGEGVSGRAPIETCSGVRPPSRLLLHPDNGVPGEYIVVFYDSVPDIPGTANSLATKYSGRILFVYETALHGFALDVADSAAVAISNEPTVCWVEQSTYGHGD